MSAAFEGTLNRPKELPGKAGINDALPAGDPFQKKGLTSMGILGSVFGYAKTRAAHRILRRAVGGPFSTILMAAFVGKKAYDLYRGRKRTRYVSAV